VVRRKALDFPRDFVLPRLKKELRTFRDLAGLFFVAVTLRTAFLTGLGARSVTLFTAGLSGPSGAAFPAIAPTTPPTTAPTGPTTLPNAAPATAPTVSFGIGGTSMFSSPFEFSPITKYLDSEYCFANISSRRRGLAVKEKKRSIVVTTSSLIKSLRKPINGHGVDRRPVVLRHNLLRRHHPVGVVRAGELRSQSTPGLPGSCH